MRSFGFLLNRTGAFHVPEIPADRLAMVSQCPRRRLDDDLEDVFHKACATGNVEAAADLLGVMERWHERRRVRFGTERRIADDTVARAHEALDRLRARHVH